MPEYNPNGDSSSAVAAVSYDIEKIRTAGLKNEDSEDEINDSITFFLDSRVEGNGFPPNLRYEDSYYDTVSRTFGSAFLFEMAFSKNLFN